MSDDQVDALRARVAELEAALRKIADDIVRALYRQRGDGGE